MHVDGPSQRRLDLGAGDVGSAAVGALEKDHELVAGVARDERAGAGGLAQASRRGGR
jgi:hypothetical protein